jgi:hypothetical protein
MLLGARIVQTTQADELPLKGPWPAYLLLTAIALAVVAGSAFVPALRLLRGTLPARRAFAGLKAIGLLATGVAGAAVVASIWGDLTWTQLLAGPGATLPPGWLMAIVIALVVGLPLAIVPAIFRGWLDALVRQSWAGWPMLVLFGIASGLVIGTSAGPLWDAWVDGPGWKRAAAAFALPGAPVIAFLCLRLWRKGLPKG